MASKPSQPRSKSAKAAAPANLVVNGGFEDGTAGWKVNRKAVSGSPPPRRPLGRGLGPGLDHAAVDGGHQRRHPTVASTRSPGRATR
ncbi:MAG: hypothetical protein R2734_02550 [Nocardioides sp.]